MHLQAIKQLATHILMIADGTTDLPVVGENKQTTRAKAYREIGRFKLDSEVEQGLDNHLMADVKCSALEILDLLFTFRMDALLETFIRDFKSQYGPTHDKSKLLHTAFSEHFFNTQRGEGHLWQDGFKYTPEYQHFILGLIPFTEGEEKQFGEEKLKRLCEEIKGADGKMKKVRILPPNEVERYSSMLLDRTGYLDAAAREVRSHDHRGHDFYSHHAFDASKLMTSPGQAPTLVNILIDCMRYQHPKLLQLATDILNRYWSMHVDLAELCITTQITVHKDSVSFYKFVTERVSAIRRLRRVKMLPNDEKRVISIMKDFAQMCRLNPYDANSEAHPMNQVKCETKIKH